LLMNVTSLERAFDLIKSGKCRSLSEIRQRLKAEGYSAEVIDGPGLCKQLNDLIKITPIH
jgi:hypothetical protein